MSEITYIYTLIYAIFSIIVLLGGIYLIKFFTDKLEYRKSYKPAIIIIVIWFIIGYFILGYLTNLLISYLYLIGFDMELVNFTNIITSIVRLLLNFIIIMLLIKYFYQSGYKDAIFITLAVISIQVFILIIIASILTFIFYFTSGGFIIFYNFYNFQYL